MAVTWDTFERYQQKGLDARRAGQWDSARIYLLEAARAMLALSKDATGEELRDSRRTMAEKLLELAKDCEKAKAEGRKRKSESRNSAGKSGGGEGGEEKEGGASANQWIVKEKPNIRFDNVAGLDKVKEDIRLKMVYPFEHPELAKKFAIRGGG